MRSSTLIFSLLDSLVASDRQGYTPYGYGVDTPVLVRSSVSYGRGWQLLRSRGEKSNSTGICDPPQLARSCNCSSSPEVRDEDESPMPRCVRTALCDDMQALLSSNPLAIAPRATIVFVLDANVSRLRFFYGRDARKLYQSQLGLAMRAIVSLRATGTTLPIHLLVSGLRSAGAETWMAAALGVGVLTTAPDVEAPSWGSKWAKGSFAKLRVLTLTQFERVILLDTDTVALGSLDVLGAVPELVPAPAAVFGWKCYPRRELRAALLVLRPSEADWRRAVDLMRDKRTATYDDLGEQSVWRRLYSSVHELPAGYAALRCSDFAADEWRAARLLHDPNLLRKGGGHGHRVGWKEAAMAERLRQLDGLVVNQTSALWAVMKAEHEAEATAAPKKAAKKRRGKRSLSAMPEVAQAVPVAAVARGDSGAN